MIANANSILQHVIQIKIKIMVHVNASVTSISHVKKVIVGILGHLFVWIVGI